MASKFGERWQKVKQHWVAIGVVGIGCVVVIALIILGYRLDWTGFNGNSKSGKTLWDWLNLLGVLAIPATVGLGSIWFTRQQAKVSDAENKDNQCEAALQMYIDKMSELLLEKNLRKSAEDDEVRTVARVRTLTVLSGLDGTRKGSVLQFLYESGLIDKNKCIVDLRGADLTETIFIGKDLSEANLMSTDLSESFFHSAVLKGCDFSWAALRGCDFDHAFLEGANFSHALLDGADFSRSVDAISIAIKLEQQAMSLKGAIMPDGSIHP